jgi:hypothetical protein
VVVQAQIYDFEDNNIGDPIDAIGWGTQVAEVADDPVSSGNNVLKFTPIITTLHRYWPLPCRRVKP